MFQKSFLCPITAVIGVQKPAPIVLAGAGPVLRLFDCSSRDVLLTYRVFDSQSIHGLRCSFASENELYCLAWGGRSVRTVSIDVRLHEGNLRAAVTQTSNEAQYTQWILHGRIIDSYHLKSGESPIEAAFVTAVNELVYMWTEISSDATRTISLRHACQGPPSMLYSVDTHLRDGNVFIASGTLFGEILIWRCSLGPPPQQPFLLSTCAGHEGSIFDVAIAVVDGDRMILSSCSDDRTVRIWDVGHLKKLTGPANGFYGALPTSVAQAASHLSRIWLIKLALFITRPGIVLSFGEDGMIQQWEWTMLPNDSSILGKLEPKRTLKVHLGRNIWSSDLLCTEGAAWVCTGGADGRIVLADLESNNTSGSAAFSFSGSDFHSTVLDGASILRDRKRKDTDETPKGLLWLNESFVLMTTNMGRVLVRVMASSIQCGDLELQSKGPPDWQEVYRSESLNPHSILCRVADIGAAIIGITGSLFLYRISDNSVTHIENLQKVKQMFAFPVRQEGTVCSAVLINCANAEIAPIFVFMTGRTRRYEVHLPPQFIVTSATFVMDQDLLLLGSRNGTVAVYSANSLSDIRLDAVCSSFHGRNAVTSILDLGVSAFDTHIILTVGRDCKLCVRSLSQVKGVPTFSMVHEAEMPAGICPEGIMLSPKTQELIAWGFKGTSLMAYNLTEDVELTKIDTGGSQRDWDLLPWAGRPNSIRVSWVRNAACHAYMCNHAAYNVVQAGSHGREIKSLAVRLDGTLLATGSEDTAIHICDFQDDLSLPFRVLARIKRHNTGLCALQWSEDGRYLFSAAGKEEFFAWRIRKLPYVEIGAICVAECPPVTRSGDLRITDFAARTVRTNDDGDVFFISMTYSDSSARIWVLDTTRVPSERLRLVAEGTYGARCLTCAFFLQNHGPARYLLTGGTDGHLALWPISEELWIQDAEPVSHEIRLVEKLATALKTKVHQSAIKCLDCCFFSGEWLVVTGGDDNALGLTLLRMGAGGEASAFTLLVPNAHAAAVTGIRVLSQVKNENATLTVATASNDQTVRKWMVTIDESAGNDTDVGRMRVEKAGCWDSSIADISDIEVFRDPVGDCRLVVAGVGVEFWKVAAGHAE